MIEVRKLFAKTEPYIGLFEHCRDTGNLAGKLWDLGLINKKIIQREQLCLLAAMHDIGKCHPSFQQKGLGKVDYINMLAEQGYIHTTEKRFRHELVTESILKERTDRFANAKTAKAFAKILRLHHQKHDFGTVHLPSPKKDDWIKAQEELIADIENYFGITLKNITFEVSDSVCTMLWGVVILADWLTSGNIEDKADVLFATSIMPKKPISEMFNIEKLRPLQEECEKLAVMFNDNSPSAIIIEAPMGEGKTEAALYLANQLLHSKSKNGIYVALPTMATARQMEERVSRLLVNNNISSAKLVHSEAWLEQEVGNQEEIDKSWFAPTKRALLSNYAVGTIDQAMMSVLKIKHGVLRLLGLNSKVLIIDEVHAYDTYMQTIIFRLMDWCAILDIPVIILSATLPSERKSKLLKPYGYQGEKLSANYPLITSIYKDTSVKENAILGAYMTREVIWNNYVFDDYDNVARLAIDAVESDGCACIIMNTVKDAQEVYRSVNHLKGEKDIKTLLFHAKFLAKDRKRIEKECLDLFSKDAKGRPQKAILVATQVVEQSLDLDFDYMISALAPIDLLLQRCGRLHRHNRIRPEKLKNPKFTVLINSTETSDTGIGRMYDAWILRQTQRVIANREKVAIPNDIRELIEYVYSENSQNEQDLDFNKWIEKECKEEISKSEAKIVVLPKPENDGFFPLDSDDFFEETSDNILSSDALTRLGSNNIKLALLPNALFNNGDLLNPTIGTAKDVMENTIQINLKRGCSGIELSEILIECGGYLKGICAMPYADEFELQFKRQYKNLNIKYKICAEYGLWEEK